MKYYRLTSNAKNMLQLNPVWGSDYKERLMIPSGEEFDRKLDEKEYEAYKSDIYTMMDSGKLIVEMIEGEHPQERSQEKDEKAQQLKTKKAQLTKARKKLKSMDKEEEPEKYKKMKEKVKSLHAEVKEMEG